MFWTRRPSPNRRRSICAELGPIDTLINAAGGNHPRATTGEDLQFFDLPADALRFVGELNLLGTILPCQVFGRAFADDGAWASSSTSRR